jgi:hypothetical protein
MATRWCGARRGGGRTTSTWKLWRGSGTPAMHEHMAGWISPRSSLCVALLLAIQVGFLLLPFFFVLLARIGFFFLVLDITSLCSSEILVIIFLVPMFLFLVSFFYLLIDRVVEDAGVG